MKINAKQLRNQGATGSAIKRAKRVAKRLEGLPGEWRAFVDEDCIAIRGTANGSILTFYCPSSRRCEEFISHVQDGDLDFDFGHDTANLRKWAAWLQEQQ